MFFFYIFCPSSIFCLKNEQIVISIFKIEIGSEVQCKIQLLVMKTLAFYWTKTAIKWTLKGFRKYTRRIKFSNKTIFLCRLSWFFCTWLNRSHCVGYNSTKDKYSVQCPGVQLPLYCSNNHLEMLLYSFPSTSQIERLAEVSKFWFEEGRRAEGQDVMWGKIKYFRNTKYSFLLGQIWQCSRYL